jgi:hypothetical protein
LLTSIDSTWPALRMSSLDVPVKLCSILYTDVVGPRISFSDCVTSVCIFTSYWTYHTGASNWA